MNLRANLEQVNQRMMQSAEKVARRRAEIHLVAVTKYFGVDVNQQLYALGVRAFAENRAESFLSKVEELAEKDGIIWHFIGNLQRRKVKKVIHFIDFFHALDRFSLAEEIEKHAVEVKKCFVEVNVSGEESKHGVAIEEVEPFLREIQDFSKIQVVGLMTMAPFAATQEQLHGYFRRLKVLQEEIARLNLPHAPCTETSMGMSSDFEIAIEEGASYVRVGGALYSEE